MFFNFDKKLTVFIAKIFRLNYKQAEIFKFAFYILALIFLLSLLLILAFSTFNNKQTINNVNTKFKNNDLEENKNIISSTPTKFVIPTPTATREEVTIKNFRNEIILNDSNLFHSITIKKNTLLKFINFTQRSIILKTSNDIFVKIDVGSSEVLSFPNVGEFIIKDAEYLDNGYYIKVNVIE